MNALRFLLKFLIACVVLVAVLIAAAWLPPTQTWAVQWYLAAHPEFHVSLGSITVRLQRIHIDDLRVERGAAVLTAPSVDVELPLIASLRAKTAMLRKVTAKGWTVQPRDAAVAGAVASTGDSSLSTPPDQAGPNAAPNTASGVWTVVRGLWNAKTLPCAVTFDRLEAEGDVLVARGDDDTPLKVHVTVAGGGLAAGHLGDFTFQATANPGTALVSRGQFTVAMGSPRVVTLGSLNAHIDVAAASRSWSAEVSAERTGADTTYLLRALRDGHELASARVRAPAGDSKLAGEWKLDLAGVEVAAFVPAPRLPVRAVTGEGRIDADLSRGSDVHVTGALQARVEQSAGALPGLQRGSMAVKARFDLVRTAQTLKVSGLDLAVTGAGAAAEVRALQPFDFDPGSRSVRLAAPSSDWVEASFRRFPLHGWPAWAGLTCRAGEIAGDVVVAAANGGYAVRSKSAVAATGLTIDGPRGAVLRGVDVSGPISLEISPKAWRAAFAPLVLTAAGRPLATIGLRANRNLGGEDPAQFSGTWSVDLDTLAGQPLNARQWLRGRSASGSFSGMTSGWTDAQLDLKVVGHDGSHTVAGKVGVELETDGAITVQAPLTFDFGSDKSDLSLKISRELRAAGPQTNVELKGEQATADHVRMLAAPFLAVVGGRWPGEPAGARVTGASAPAARDAVPFWGDWEGRIDVDLSRLQWDSDTWLDAGGTIRITPARLRLEGGRGKIPAPAQAHRLQTILDAGDDPLRRQRVTPTQVRLEGSIQFDPQSAEPYTLKGTTEREDIDGAMFFAAAAKDEDPPFEGRFAFTSTVTGQAATPGALLAHPRREIRFTSTTGIFRLLKTNVAAALPPPKESRAGNALSGVGTAAGWLFGNGKAFAGSGEVKVSKAEEAVLEFRNAVAEIGYDQIAGTAICAPDGTIRLTDLSLTAKDAHLTGSGEIGAAAGRPVRERPLSITLHLGTRGRIAGLAEMAGVASSRNDEQGYLLVDSPVHFGGTLEHPDDHEWRDLLVKAALRPAPKK